MGSSPHRGNHCCVPCFVYGIEQGMVTLLGYAIVTEEMSNDADSGAVYSKGKSICEYFDDAKLPDVLAKYEKVAKVALVK